MSKYNIPEGLKYSKDDEWIKVDGDIATIGITDFAQSELGDIVFVDLPNTGCDLEAGEVFGTIEAVKTVADGLMPIAGNIVESNDESLADNPKLVNDDPYGEGWMIKVKVANPADLDNLLTAEQYIEKISK